MAEGLHCLQSLAVEGGAGEFEAEEGDGAVESGEHFGEVDGDLFCDLAGFAVFWVTPACEEEGVVVG